MQKAYKINLADAIFDNAQKEFMLEEFVKNAINETLGTKSFYL